MPKFERIVVLTGAGVSAESGLATFRDKDGIWSKYDYREVATPEGFGAIPPSSTTSTTSAAARCEGSPPTPPIMPSPGSSGSTGLGHRRYAEYRRAPRGGGLAATSSTCTASS